MMFKKIMAQPLVITNKVVRGIRSLARMGCNCVEFIGLDALTLLGSFLILLGRVAKVLSHPDEAAYIRIYNPYTKGRNKK